MSKSAFSEPAYHKCKAWWLVCLNMYSHTSYDLRFYTLIRRDSWRGWKKIRSTCIMQGEIMNNKDFLPKKNHFIFPSDFFGGGGDLQWMHKCCKLIPNRFINSNTGAFAYHTPNTPDVHRDHRIGWRRPRSCWHLIFVTHKILSPKGSWEGGLLSTRVHYNCFTNTESIVIFSFIVNNKISYKITHLQPLFPHWSNLITY